jgi:hypothetical protein
MKENDIQQRLSEFTGQEAEYTASVPIHLSADTRSRVIRIICCRKVLKNLVVWGYELIS